MSIAANQRLFTEAWITVTAQGRPSMGDFGSCAYRSGAYPNEGCAFAPAINKYTDRMEGHGSEILLTQFRDDMYEWARDITPAVASSIQAAHDNAEADAVEGVEFIDEFQHAMRSIADLHGFEVPS